MGGFVGALDVWMWMDKEKEKEEQHCCWRNGDVHAVMVLVGIFLCGLISLLAAPTRSCWSLPCVLVASIAILFFLNK